MKKYFKHLLNYGFEYLMGLVFIFSFYILFIYPLLFCNFKLF